MSTPPARVASVIAVTCTRDGQCHRVADDALAVTRATGGGQYAALCGHRVVAAALACPPGPDCQGCAALAATPRRVGRGRHRHGTRAGRHQGGA